MIVLKDVDNVLSDFKIDRHILNNDRNSTELTLLLNVKNPFDSHNKHFHLFSIAQLHPPFIINPLVKEEDYYPIFWFAEYYKDDLADVHYPGAKTPNFYSDNNTFFLAIRRLKDFERVEEYMRESLLTYGLFKCEIFYKEKN